MWQRKKSGNVLMGTILAAIVMIFVANAYFTTLGGSFQLLKSSRTAQQAQQFAEIEANTLKLKDYDEIDSLAHPRRSLTGVIDGADGWEDTITIGDEKMIGDNKQRIASIEIYQAGDALARYRLQVPLTSQGSGGSLPLGTILPYVGDLNKIPKGWYLCNGENDTPNLISGRFLQGSTVKGEYINAGIPNIKGFAYATDDAFVGTVSGPFGIYSSNNNWNWDENNYPHGILVDFDASRSSSVYRNDINTVQPAAYTVYYIIRLK